MRSGAAGRIAALAAGAAAACVFSAVAPSLAAPPSGCHQLHGTVTCTFAYTGAEQQLSIPADVASVHVSLTGAAGGTGNVGGAVGGVGGSASGDMSVTGGEVLYVEVGGQGGTGILSTGGSGGFNGGADGGIGRGGGGGGGATDLRTVSCGSDCPGDADSLASRLIVAGGGGGAAGNASAGSGDGGAAGSAGEGGFLSTNPTGGAGGGGGGTTSGGGAGGAASFCGSGSAQNGFAGAAGGTGSGGAGATGAPQFGGGVVTNSATAGGGGGGGGAYGGGGGGSTGTDTQCGAGGGGGGSSSYSSVAITNPSLGLAASTDPAAVTITYAAPASSSKTYYVAHGGPAASCATNSQANPFATIQEALACAGDGDVVSLHPSGTPYPGIGTVTSNVTIEAGPGGNARNVRVDLSQPDNSSGTLTVPADNSVEVDGLTLDCVSHACVNPDVTNNGELVLRGDTITGAGKAVAVQNATTSASEGANLTVFGSTIAHNTNDYGPDDTTLGGGIQSDDFGGPESHISLANSTIADNTSGGVGGGIAAFFNSSVNLVNTTIVGNRALSPLGGGGIYVPDGAAADAVAMSNTLISDNLADAGGGPDCDGTLADGPGGHNLIADPTRCQGLTDRQHGDLLAIAGPGVSPIGNFGGPTDTAALERTSVAIGNGDSAACASSDVVGGLDQRGVDRKASTRGSCDIGAYDTGGSGAQQFHTWYVAPGGAAGACASNSAAQPFATIQQALACAGDGDVVKLAPSGSTPYPGVGEIDHNLTIEAADGGNARSVKIDLSQPDNESGPMQIPDSVSAEVDGVTLDCVSHECEHPDVLNYGTLTLREVEVTGAGLAPGISNTSNGLKHANLTVLGSAIVHNTDAQDLDGQAGGLSSSGGPAAIVTMADSTIADNASTGIGQGGGIFVISTVMTLENVTITGNHASGFFGGGGTYVPAGGASNTIAMSNTLIAGNTADNGGTDCQGELGDGPGHHNVIGDASQCTGVVDGGGNQLGAGDAGIGTLGYNGGPTETVPLEDGNVGLAAGDTGTCEDALVGDADQRGVARHTGSRSACNVGAWDSAGDANTAPSVSVSTPADGAHYTQGSTVKAAYSCPDPDGAGDVKTCQGDVADGGSLDTSTAGAHSFTVQAEDWDGHTASKTVGYTVDARPPDNPPGGGAGGGGGGNPQPGSGGKAPVASPSADLTLSRRVSPRHLSVGRKVTFTLIAHNRGPSKATRVVLSAALPRSLKLLSVHRVHGVRCTRRVRRLTCRVASIRAGATLRVRFVAKAVRAGRSHLTLRVTARERDPKRRNNKLVPKTSVTHRARRAAHGAS